MNQNNYIPGVCNIGKEEIARRSSKLKFALVLLLVATIFYFVLPFNTLLFSGIGALACYSSILIFQIRQKFCIVFGWKNVFNFKGIKERKERVQDDAWRKLDRIQVIKILCYSFLLSGTFIVLLLRLSKKI